MSAWNNSLNKSSLNAFPEAWRSSSSHRVHMFWNMSISNHHWRTLTQVGKDKQNKTKVDENVHFLYIYYTLDIFSSTKLWTTVLLLNFFAYSSLNAKQIYFYLFCVITKCKTAPACTYLAVLTDTWGFNATANVIENSFTDKKAENVKLNFKDNTTIHITFFSLVVKWCPLSVLSDLNCDTNLTAFKSGVEWAYSFTVLLPSLRLFGI